MTAKTSQYLADALRGAGFEDLALRAEADEFHDFLADVPLPQMVLHDSLMDRVRTSTGSQQMAAVALINRLKEGEFDASEEEGDEWARSEEGQATFAELLSKEPGK